MTNKSDYNRATGHEQEAEPRKQLEATSVSATLIITFGIIGGAACIAVTIFSLIPR